MNLNQMQQLNYLNIKFVTVCRQNRPQEAFYKKGVVRNFTKIHQTLVAGSLFNKGAGCGTDISKNTFHIEHLWTK